MKSSLNQSIETMASKKPGKGGLISAGFRALRCEVRALALVLALRL